ncbi:DUF1760-domain-containing protein [Saccharata proteae CBS 121410]|uniref:DUF1760-domain-containing protein n=1 Tax=Saccharata proteae CBS 121410 TaxID=1314787 RepID=A0A9P4LVF6_9PEZI|nr:DUF1760-domain-containing protein [Saccharata proteae CBS 121410]
MPEEEHPLIAGLPPAMDYLTYLTLVEHNMSPEILPVLHNVLQDAELTANIGWDLVQLLLPLLPASETCLQDIARLGNPREVVLKATEALRLIDFETLHAEDAEAEEEEEDDDDDEAVPGVEIPKANSSKEGGHEELPPLQVVQFEALLSMISILHPRIKTKYPSRFLSTTLQAVLASYNEAGKYANMLTPAVGKLVKELSGTKRPHLPLRMSSSSVLKSSSFGSAPDPEASKEASSPEEDGLQKRLLQSFLTHVLEDYMNNLSSSEDIPALAWTSRLHEKLHPERVLSERPTFAGRFATKEDLKARTYNVGQLAALTRDLGLSSDELYATILDSKPEASGLPTEEDDPPESPEDIPLSKTGSLYLFAGRKVAEVLYGSSTDRAPLPIFPDHNTILQNFLGENSTAVTGTEPDALVDSILTLGVLALENNAIGEPVDDEQFAKYLQMMSLLATNNPSPPLRYFAHYITSTVLRSHPHDLVRLSFIRDTLEHCPYENLKATAVGWLKGETIEANIPLLADDSTDDNDHGSIFVTPVALVTCSPYLFPDLTHDLSTPDLSASYDTFRANLSLYLATLNFYYLLLTARPLHAVLDVPGLHEGSDVGGSYLYPLRQAVERFRKGLGEGGELAAMEGKEGINQGLADLHLLEDVLDRVEKGVVALNRAA